jgi:RHS repeat-associated protein
MNGQTLQKAFIPLPGNGQAVYNSGGLLYYGHSDHLGSVRLGSTPARTSYFDLAHAPFGETYAISDTSDPAWTGQRQDTVTGLYDFPAREYSTQGRWPSPDPAGLSAVDPSTPQSWNRYAYVINNPLAAIDPLGLDLCYLNGQFSQDEAGCPAGTNVNCTMDQSSIDSGTVLGAIAAEMAAQCPNNDCTGIRLIQEYGGQNILQRLIPQQTWTSGSGTDSDPWMIHLKMAYWQFAGYGASTAVSWWGTFASSLFTTNPSLQH